MSRLLTWLFTRLRRSRFLPAGMLNRVSELETAPRPLDARVIVWFPTALDSLYQLRPWYAALRALDATHRLTVICRDSRVAATIRDESDLDALSLATSAELEQIADGVRVALYVNLDPLDFDCLRFPSMTHVFIGHGDSDKAVFTSNQVKAFDRYFVAGPAAVERLAGQLDFYDTDAHVVVVGQPQLDGMKRPDEPGPGRPVVVYTPTWEGAHSSVAYSSLLTHGIALIDSLVADGGYDLVYRPHPFTGHEDPAHGEADRAIAERVRRAGGRVDASPDLATAFNGASVLITDVSGVISFWLPTGRPILIAQTASAAPAGTLTAELPQLPAEDATRTADRVRELLADPPELAPIAEHHLGDLTPGAAIATFVEAVTRLIDEREALARRPTSH